MQKERIEFIMSEIFEKLCEKIDEQAKGLEGTAVFAVGLQLKDICRGSDAAAEIVLQDLDVAEMSIIKCEKEIKAFADERHKIKRGSSVFVSPTEAEEIICKFYGISEAVAEAEEKPTKDDNVINLEDFLS